MSRAPVTAPRPHSTDPSVRGRQRAVVAVAGRLTRLGGRISTRLGLLGWLLSGFRVVAGPSGDEARDEGAEESFAPAAHVMYELEEAEIERQLLLRDAPVRPQPRAQ